MNITYFVSLRICAPISIVNSSVMMLRDSVMISHNMNSTFNSFQSTFTYILEDAYLHKL